MSAGAADPRVEVIANCERWRMFKRWKNHLPYAARIYLARAAVAALDAMNEEANSGV